MGEPIKTVVENDAGLDRRNLNPIKDDCDPTFLEYCESYKPKSCFYDFGAPSIVEFVGFVDTGDSAYVDEIGECFKK